MAAKTPLNDKHKQLLDKLLQSCVDTEQYLAGCADCEIDVTPERRRNDEQKRIAEKIKARNFPHSK